MGPTFLHVFSSSSPLPVPPSGPRCPLLFPVAGRIRGWRRVCSRWFFSSGAHLGPQVAGGVLSFPKAELGGSRTGLSPLLVAQPSCHIIHLLPTIPFLGGPHQGVDEGELLEQGMLWWGSGGGCTHRPTHPSRQGRSWSSAGAFPLRSCSNRLHRGGLSLKGASWSLGAFISLPSSPWFKSRGVGRCLGSVRN